MISGMNYWSRENPPPASFFVISGVKALLSALEDFHNRNYNIFVAHPDGYSPADLVPTASCLWDFKSFIHNGPPYHPRTEMLPHSIKEVQDQRSCLNYPLLTMQEHLLEITEEKIPARLQIKIDRSCQGSGVQSLLLLLLHKKLRNERFIPSNIMSFDFSKLSLKDAGRCQTRPDQDRESWLLKWCPKPATAEQIRIV